MLICETRMSSAVWTLAESFEWRRLEPDCLWITSFVRLLGRSLLLFMCFSRLKSWNSCLMFSALASYVIVSSCFWPVLRLFFSSVTYKIMTSPVWSTLCCFLACSFKASFRDFRKSSCTWSCLFSVSESDRIWGRCGVVAPPVVGDGDEVCS